MSDLAIQKPRSPSHERLAELFRFVLVGGTSAGLYVGLCVLFAWLGLRPSLAILATLAVLVPPTYLAQRNLTFRSGRGHAAAFPRYAGTQVAGNALALALSEGFAAFVRQHPWIGFGSVALTVALTNYALLKLWAFRHDR